MMIKRILIQNGVDYSFIKMCCMIDSMKFDLKRRFVRICLKFLISIKEYCVG